MGRFCIVKYILWLLLLVGTLYAQKNVLSQEMQAMQKACSKKVATACYEFGLLYEEGIGVKSDIGKAKEYYMQACNNGFDKACKRYKRLHG